MKPSTQTLHNFLNMMPSVFYEYLQHQDGTSEVLYVSPSSKEILGHPPEYFIEDINHFGGIIHPKDLERIKKHYADTIDSDIATVDARIILPSGEVRWIKFGSKPVSRTKKGSVAWNGFCVDITSQMETEERLRQSEKRFRVLIETLPEAIFESDINVNLIYANQKAFKLFGYTKHDLENGLNGIDLLVPEDRKRAKENLLKRFQGEKIGINEYEALKKDGSSFPVLLHAMPILEQGGNIKGIRGIIVDITKRKQIEQELIKEKKNLEEVNAVLKIILREHELRKTQIEEKIFLNIEKLLLPYLSELKSSNLNENQHFLLDVIQKNIEEITGSFSRDLTHKYNNLTPREIQVANLIKQGRTNKEIAKFLSLSPSAVDFHRQNLRLKLNIKGKKENLRSILLNTQF